jgi:hypothetical protein
LTRCCAGDGGWPSGILLGEATHALQLGDLGLFRCIGRIGRLENQRKHGVVRHVKAFGSLHHVGRRQQGNAREAVIVLAVEVTVGCGLGLPFCGGGTRAPPCQHLVRKTRSREAGGHIPLESVNKRRSAPAPLFSSAAGVQGSGSQNCGGDRSKSREHLCTNAARAVLHGEAWQRRSVSRRHLRTTRSRRVVRRPRPAAPRRTTPARRRPGRFRRTAHRRGGEGA